MIRISPDCSLLGGDDGKLFLYFNRTKKVRFVRKAVIPKAYEQGSFFAGSNPVRVPLEIGT